MTLYNTLSKFFFQNYCRILSYIEPRILVDHESKGFRSYIRNQQSGLTQIFHLHKKLKKKIWFHRQDRYLHLVISQPIGFPHMPASFRRGQNLTSQGIQMFLTKYCLQKVLLSMLYFCFSHGFVSLFFYMGNILN